MARSVSWGIGVFAGLLLLAACGEREADSETNRPQFLTTIPPLEMILEPVVAGRGRVKGLLAPGASPHTFEPSPSDLRAATNGTALVSIADHLDGWAVDLPARRRVVLADLLPPSARLAFSEEGRASGDSTIDPHFWTDPVAVQKLLPVLADTLCGIDAGGCSAYRTNADSFATVLDSLDTRLEAVTGPVRGTPVLLAQPFFRYFLRRYGLRLVGIVEPRPGTEPSPRQLQRLVQRARSTEAQAILTQKSLSGRAARAVAEAAEVPIVALDPLGGTEGRRSYTELLLTNARILRDSLAGSR